MRGKMKKVYKNCLFHLNAGKINIVELLIEHGCNVSATNNFGETPLHYAAFVGLDLFVFGWMIVTMDWIHDT